jgi:hypothetical protein
MNTKRTGTANRYGIRTTPALKTPALVAAERAEIVAWHKSNGNFFGMTIEQADAEARRLGGVDNLPTRAQYEAHDRRLCEVLG